MMARKLACILSVCVFAAALALAATDPAQEYKDRAAKIDPASSDAHYGLAEWAFNNNLLDSAKKELTTALQLDKNNRKAQLLMTQVDAAIREKPADGNTATVPTTSQSAEISLADREKMLVSAEDISRIRLAEMTNKDDQVRVEFKNKLPERFIASMRSSSGFDADAFRKFPPAEQAITIRDQSRDNPAWLDDIVVKSDPKFMTEFRLKVWPTVQTNCASVSCHGGDHARGGLRLFNMRSSERADYTNYLILDLARTHSGRLINRDYPEDSLLLRYSVQPENNTTFRHPKSIPAAFPNRDAQGYRNIEDWMKLLQPPPHPNYNLKYVPPEGVKFDVGSPALQFNSAPSTPASGPAKVK